MDKKTKLIPILMITIIIILAILFIITNTTKIDNIYDHSGTYTKTIYKYINDELYSITTIKIKLDNGTYTYIETIKYADINHKDYQYQKANTYIEDNNKIISDEYILYINNDELCIDESGCFEYLSKEKEATYKKELHIDINKQIIDTKKITKTDNKQVYIVIDNKDYLDTLKYLIYDYDITFNIINLNNLNKQQKKLLKDEYDIITPSIIILDKDNIYYQNNELLSEIEFSKILEKQGFKSR